MRAEPPTLETQRLILRAWHEDDLDPFTEMMGEPEVARWLTLDGKPQDRGTVWRTMALMMGHWALKGFGNFVVEEKGSRAFVGRVGPWSPEGWPGHELGWGIARAFWGRGYAQEAARAAGDWTFETFKPESLISIIHVDNIRSQNLAQRLGERPDKPTIHAGQPHVIWKVTAQEWLSASP